MRRFLSLLLLFVLSLPAMAALPVGPERAVAQLTAAPTPGHDYPLAVATDGTDFLAVWANGRWGYEATYAAKVSERGAVSPMPSQRIDDDMASGAALEWTGRNYLLLWYGSAGGVQRVLLDRDANIIRGSQKVPTSATSAQALAWDGRRAIAIGGDGQGMIVMVLNADGTLVRDVRVPGMRAAGDVSVVTVEGGFVAVWAENQRVGAAIVRAMRISPEGDPGTPVLLPSPSMQGAALHAESNGARVGVAYTQFGGPGSGTPGLQPLRRVTLDAQTLAVTEHPVVQGLNTPSVVATPGGFVAATLASRGNAPVLESIPFDTTQARANDINGAPANRLLTASNGRSVLAVWTRGYVAGAIFDAAVTRRETNVFAVSTTVVGQSRPRLAAAADVALLTWIEETVDGGDLLAMRIDRSGRAIGAPVRVAGGQWIETGHTAAFTGRVWLVSWQVRTSSAAPHTFVQSIGLDGQPIGQPLDFGVGGPAAMAANGDLVVVARPTFAGVEVRRFSLDGTPLDDAPSYASNTPDGGSVEIASNGSDFLLVWDAAQGTKSKIMGRRLGVSGHPIDAASFVIESAPAYAWAPHVISDGTDYLVAFQVPGSNGNTNIVVQRVLRSGALAERGVVAEGVMPRMALVDTRVVLSYLGSRSGTDLQLIALDDREPVRVAESITFIQHDLAESAGGSLWLVYSRVVRELGDISRVFVRVVGEQPTGKRRAARR